MLPHFATVASITVICCLIGLVFSQHYVSAGDKWKVKTKIQITMR